ncbi:MAG: class I SAM-dependent methyltransferase [Thermomicrobiales bacterium]
MTKRTRRTDEFEDANYLRTEQYHDGTNLSARENLHRRFSTNRTDWFRWIFDHLNLPNGSRILELGCGTGSLWLQNRDRLPASWKVTLSDFSPGMLAATRERLNSISPSLMTRYCVANAQAIPFADSAFDTVIANHMLYHVPDRARAFEEICRILRPGGQFYASTNGQQHLQELDALVCTYAPHAERENAAVGFGLENGARQLRPWFVDVTSIDYPDALEVTEVEPLIDYVLSTRAKKFLDETRLHYMRQAVADEIARTGAFRVTKAVGLFSCRIGETH